MRQARWTRAWRLRLYRQAGLWQARNILDVGCGTGVITEEIARHTRGKVIGLDIDPAMIKWANSTINIVEWKVGDAHELPFGDEQFDLVVCNFLLLWVRDPDRVVQEMARVVKKGGVVLDTSEPDYGGRIDFPEDLPPVELMSRALREVGANPHIGRQLRKLFAKAKLNSEIGVIASVWDQEQMATEFEEEWQFTERVLAEVAEPRTLKRYREFEKKALQAGERFIFMPFFYASGRK